MSKFNIGDEVRVPRTKESGTITDKMYSEANDHYLYVIKPHDGGRSFIRKHNDIEPFLKQSEYRIDTQIADNVVVGIIYEIIDGNEVEVCRGHGHIIHDGAEGVAQACSYAYKKALNSVDSGIYFKQNKER